jgi:hypothetical protein
MKFSHGSLSLFSLGTCLNWEGTTTGERNLVASIFFLWRCLMWSLWVKLVGNVFWLPIRQIKFFGTIEFLVSILDLNIQICRPFVPWKISYMPIEYLVLEIIYVSMICHFLFALLITIESEEHLETPWCNMLVKRWHIALCWEDKINLWNLPSCICFTIAQTD